MKKATTKKPPFVPDTAPVLCPNGTVVCLASGPSLTQEDVEYCRGKVDLVIAVNDAWKLAPWAGCLYSSDQFWWPHYRYVPDFTGLKITCDPTLKPGVVLTLKRTGKEGIEWSPNGLRSAQNSGGAAINLAVHLCGGTPKKIVLLGYDMGATGEGHFFGAHPSGLRSTQSMTYGLFRKLTETMVEPLRARGVEVLNASRKSALRGFPRVSLREALPS